MAACLGSAGCWDWGTLADVRGPLDASDAANDLGLDQTPVCNIMIPVPRATAPMSTSFVNSVTPTLRWDRLPAGVDTVAIEICSNRACSDPIRHFNFRVSSPMQSAPSMPLADGVWFWRLTAWSGSCASAASPWWEFRVRNIPSGSPATHSGAVWGTFFDPEGDGRPDIVVGAPGDPTHAPGDVTVVSLAAAAVGAPHGFPTATSQSVTRPRPGNIDGFGSTVASGGDLNGDGYADLLVGAPYSAGFTQGHAYYFLSRGDGTFDPGVELSGESCPMRPADAMPALCDMQFGAAVAAAGDVDGNGYGDIIVGAPRERGTAGNVYVYFMGVDTTGTIGVIGDVIIAGLSTGSAYGFGTSVTGAADLDHCGAPDIVAGEPSTNTVYVFSGHALAMHIGPVEQTMHPTISPLTASATFLEVAGLISTCSGGRNSFGETVTIAGDFDGDGQPDLAVSNPGACDSRSTVDAYGNGDGMVEVFRDYAHPSNRCLITPGGSGSFGVAMHGMVDINRDGYDDLAIGAPTAAPPYGELTLAYGTTTCQTITTNPIPVPATQLSRVHANPCASGGTPINSQFGWAIGAFADLNGDDFDDLAVGSPICNEVELYYTLPPALPSTVWSLVTDATGQPFTLNGSTTRPSFGASIY